MSEERSCADTADGAEPSLEANLPEQPVSKKPKTVVERATSATDLPEEAAAPVDSGRQSDSPETAARHCELYCALCTKRHALLVHLFAVYGQCKDRSIGRAAIMRNAEGLARVLGPEAPALLALVAQNPPGSLPLLLKMLNFLTEVQTPPQVKRITGKSQKARFLSCPTLCCAFKASQFCFVVNSNLKCCVPISQLVESLFSSS